MHRVRSGARAHRRSLTAFVFILLFLLQGGCNPDNTRPSASFAGQETESEALAPFDLRDLISIIDLSSLSVSNNGKLVAVQQRHPTADLSGYELSWVLINIDRPSKPVTLVDAGDPRPTILASGYQHGSFESFTPKWSSSDTHLAFVRRLGGLDVLSIFDVKSGKTTNHSTDGRDVLAFEWSVDNAELFYISSAHRTLTPQGGRRFEAGFNVSQSWSPLEIPDRPSGFRDVDFARFAGERYPLRRLSIQKKISRPATPEDWNEYRELVGLNADVVANISSDVISLDMTGASNAVRLNIVFSAQRRFAAWTQNANPKRHVGSIAPQSVWFAEIGSQGPPSVCEHDLCTGYIHDLVVGGLGDVVVFRKSTGPDLSEKVLVVWNVLSGAVSVVRNQVEKLSECTLSRGKMICIHETALTPPAIIAIDLKMQSAIFVYRPNNSIEDRKFPRVDRYIWNINEMDRSAGHLIFPLNYQPGERYPLVIACYGDSGFLRGATGDHTPLIPLANHGFFVLRCKFADHFYRDVYSSEGDQALITRRLFGRGEDRAWRIMAIGAAVNKLVGDGLIDPERIAMTGFSEGANTTAQALISADFVKVASLQQASPNRLLFHTHPPSVQEYLSRAGRGLEDEAWSFVSLAENADKISAPILIQASQAEGLAAVLDHSFLYNSGVPVELWIYADEFHEKSIPRNKLQVYSLNLDWMRFWLQGEEDADPTRAEQYERWREMRDGKQ